MKARLAELSVVVLMMPLVARAQVRFAGTEFQVNTYTSSNQEEQAICRAADGRFVVVWESGADHDGDLSGVFAQRYASNGDELGTEFQVNTYTTESQEEPRICCDEEGNFVVVWESYGQDGESFGVFARRFGSDGSFLGAEFQVNTYTTANNGMPDVCCDATGNFTVVWESERDGSIDGVFGQRFASAGTSLGTEFQINTFTTGEQDNPRVCCAATGDFVVVWESTNQPGDEDDGVFGQRFASNGSFRGTEFQVNTFTSADQDYPVVCCSASGDFVVAWEGSGNQDGDEEGVFAQRFASSGARRGPEFQVNVFTSGSQEDPTICCRANGDFVIAWQSEHQDGNAYGVFARQFSNAVLSGGPEFQVNTYTTDNQDEPEIACDAKGNFVVVWESFSQDGDLEGVFGQRFELLGIQSTPALSFGGIAVGVVALLGAGAKALRRRRKGS